MKLGQPVEALLEHPIYTQNKLALPAGIVLRGSVVSLEPNRELRDDARLNADFTPYHRPAVTFTGATLSDGTNVFFVHNVFLRSLRLYILFRQLRVNIIRLLRWRQPT